MRQGIRGRLQELAERLLPKAPTAEDYAQRFGDPLAGQVDWRRALSKSSTGLCSHRLVFDGNRACHFQMTGSVKAFVGLFIGIGLLMMVLVGGLGLSRRSVGDPE